MASTISRVNALLKAAGRTERLRRHSSGDYYYVIGVAVDSMICAYRLPESAFASTVRHVEEVLTKEDRLSNERAPEFRFAPGKWCENARPARGPINWTTAGNTKNAVAVAETEVGEAVIARLRHVTGGYVAKIEGWQWKVTPDMPTARLNEIPGDKIEFTPAKFFPSRGTAQREVELILRTLP